jgi:hypothetical protein|tara:strand:- start:39 stop:1013 length:975 start_codon:yes stop_codon:yes gene_type:complete
MAIFGNFKGTTTSEFKIGKSSSGNKMSTGTRPSSNQLDGDIHFNSANATLDIYESGWKNIGSTLTELNVDSGTLFVDSANDTVSIGSTASNERLFVNGSLRLGTNPAIKYSGAYLDVSHANGTATQFRIRDNTSGANPIFKIYDASNTNEVFKVNGSSTTINNSYSLPITDGTAGQAVTTDGSGALSFTTLSANPEGSNTDIQFNDSGSFGGNDALTYDKSTSTLQTGIVQGVLFEPITDYGSIEDTANMTISFGTVIEPATSGDYEYIKDIAGPTSDEFSVSNLPDASVAGQMIYVGDETAGSVMAFSDGSNWRRITDRVIVS